MRTLLLADDSVTTQRLIALTFAEEELRVVTVSDGQQAIDAMSAMPPDIVLAATTLPRTSGYELAEYMRGLDALRDVPLLLLSGAFESVDEARLKSSGARGVIEKPIEPTAVISRVRELLGFKDTRPVPSPAGRLVSAIDAPAAHPSPGRPAAPGPDRTPPVSSWEERRQESSLEPDARPVEGGTPGSGREDYLDTLDAAFDSLDQHLSGRNPEPNASQRNPSPPLGQAGGAPDPRSPGRRPKPKDEGAPANSVFEVDGDWFADDHKAGAAAAGQDMLADAHAAMPPRPDAAGANPIFEVDDEWFAEDEAAREARRAQQRELAAEMGIHDVELPTAEPALIAPAAADGLDFDFGLDDLIPGQTTQRPDPDSPFAPPAAGKTPPPAPVPPVLASAPLALRAPWAHETPLALEAPLVPEAPPAPQALLAPQPLLAPEAPMTLEALFAPEAPWATLAHETAPAPLAHGSVADDFAAMLAFETGDLMPETPPPPAAAAPEPAAVQAIAPEITDHMLERIAERVAERLASGAFGAQLRDALSATVSATVSSTVSAAVRDTVRSVVSETSERLVRDEIERIKSKTHT